MREPPTDADLLRRFRAGEARAFEVLVDRYKRPLYVLLARLVGDRHAAEDLLQEAFVRLWRGADRLDDSGPLYGWLRRTAVNLGINHIRGRSRRSAATVASADNRPGPSGWEAPGADSAGTSDAVAEAMNELPEEQRTCLVLRVQEEMSYSDIAEATGVARGTVMSRLSRARLALREKLKERAVI